MAVSFLTSLSEEEFKKLLKQSLLEIFEEKSIKVCFPDPEMLDVEQAAIYLKCKVTTLYEKTSRKTIPHVKKGNRLYFKRQELQEWLTEGMVKPIKKSK